MICLRNTREKGYHYMSKNNKGVNCPVRRFEAFHEALCTGLHLLVFYECLGPRPHQTRHSLQRLARLLQFLQFSHFAVSPKHVLWQLGSKPKVLHGFWRCLVLFIVLKNQTVAFLGMALYQPIASSREKKGRQRLRRSTPVLGWES